MSASFLDYALAAPLGARRVLASHCPGCNRPHDVEPRHVGAWVAPDDHTENVVCGLCAPCGQRFNKAGKRGRKRFTARIEANLEAAGVLEGIKKDGLKA